MQIRIGKAFWMILAIAGITLFIARIVGDELIYRAFYFWLGLIVFSLAWTISSLLGIDFQRRSREYQLEVGEYLEEKYTITNNSSLRKIWLEVIDQSGIGQTEPRLIASLPGRSEKQYTAHRYMFQRGQYDLGPTIIRSGDIFGLFRATKTFLSDQTILVTPAIIKIEPFRQRGSELSGGDSTHEISDETNALTSGIREYMPGDALKRIHWPSSVKHQKLIVKEYDKDPLFETVIIVDNFAPDQWVHEMASLDINPWMISSKTTRPIVSASFEYITCLAASISMMYRSLDSAFGLMYVDEGFHSIQPDKGDRQYLKILERLSIIQDKSTEPISEYSSLLVNEIRPGSQVILITATSSEAILELVEDLLTRGMEIIVLLLDRSSFHEVPDNQNIKLELDKKGVECYAISKVDKVAALENLLEALREARLVSQN